MSASALEAVHHTQRLRLEPLLPAHAAELCAPLSDPALYAHVPDAPPASVAALAARFARLAGRRSPDGVDLWLNWVMRAASGPVGLLQATVHPDRTAEVAYTVFAAAQRQGYATEALRWLVEHLAREHGVREARATVDARNVASVRLLGRCGFHLVRSAPDPADSGAVEHHFARPLG